jgi:aspartyl aminopeptidase
MEDDPVSHVTDEQRATCADLLEYLDASPSPWHAVDEAARRLESAGFTRLREEETWSLEPGRGYYLIRGGSSLAAFLTGLQDPAEGGFHIVGAHTDSPGLRVKPKGEHAKGGLVRVGVEVYGGPILATWTDRELGLAGRLALRAADGGLEEVTVTIQRPLLRLANPAIHLNREVNNKGLLLDKQEELPLLLAQAEAGLPDGGILRELLAYDAEVDVERILGFDLCAWDLQEACTWGADDEFIASGRLDNLAMCHAGLAGLLQAAQVVQPPASTAVLLLFDHEEVGSQSAMGADGSLLPDVLERIHEARGGGRAEFLRACSRSFLVSADMAHALHPNYLRLHEPQHHVFLNQGPVIKLNSNLRYTTDGASLARFTRICEQAEVPVQTYVHRTDLPCGTTIGPMASSRLGIRAVDVGNPMLSMHSVRESAGAADPLSMNRALAAFFLGA